MSHDLAMATSAGRFVQVSPGSVTIGREAPGARRLSTGEARVSVLACGICGTDLHLWHGMRLPTGVTYPIRPGHEVCGRVVELDAAAASTGPQVGDLVVLHPVRPCGTCATCLSGLDQLCPQGAVLGIHEHGGLADEVVWPADRMVVVDGLEPAQAAVLADAVATAYRAVRSADLAEDAVICVIGAGGVGTHVLELVRSLHPAATLVGVTRTERSADRLRSSGIAAETGGTDLVKRLRARYGTFDTVFEFSGAPESPAQAIRLLTTGGTLVFGSVLTASLDLGPAQALQTRELTVKGVFNSSLTDLREVVELAMTGRIDLSRSVSHTAGLSDAAEAFALLGEGPPGLVRMVLTTGAEDG